MAKIKICLDAGHYGKYNRSPAIPAYYESEMNWKLHLKLKAALEAYGVEVITTRPYQSEDLALQARGKKSKGCDLFLSIHSNSVGGSVNESVDHPLAIVPVSGKVDDIGKKLANCIRDTMGTTQAGKVRTKTTDDGKYDWYGVIYGAYLVGVPGIILEHSFHSQTRATKWLMDDSNLDKMAQAEAAVIAEHYGLKNDGTPTPAEHTYTQKQFVMDIQAATGAVVDGIAGRETISKTVTVSAYKNNRHAVVKPVQKWLNELGYAEVGKADGIAGRKFTAAVKAYQQDNGCVVDGEITAKNKTWRKLLGME